MVQCHEILDHFLGLKDSTWKQMGTDKDGFKNFFVFAKSHTKMCVLVVVDCADTMSAWSLTTLTRCRRGRARENF